MDTPYILDACCGGRMCWFNKHDQRAIFMDIRQGHYPLCDGRTHIIAPDILADFRSIPYPDTTFSIVLFDPPHLRHAGKSSWLTAKYGTLNHDWRDDLRLGFKECYRVLKKHGTLIFKWNEDQISITEVLNLAPFPPLFGTRRGGGTLFIVFTKD